MEGDIVTLQTTVDDQAATIVNLIGSIGTLSERVAQLWDMISPSWLKTFAYDQSQMLAGPHFLPDSTYVYKMCAPISRIDNNTDHPLVNGVQLRLFGHFIPVFYNVKTTTSYYEVYMHFAVYSGTEMVQDEIYLLGNVSISALEATLDNTILVSESAFPCNFDITVCINCTEPITYITCQPEMKWLYGQLPSKDFLCSAIPKPFVLSVSRGTQYSHGVDPQPVNSSQLVKDIDRAMLEDYCDINPAQASQVLQPGAH